MSSDVKAFPRIATMKEQGTLLQEPAPGPEEVQLSIADRSEPKDRSGDIAIHVSNLSKCYQMYDSPRDRLKQFIYPRLLRLAMQAPKQYFREFWALKDITFDIKKGETVGIIGRNGSGKSTLLQIICGTLTPTGGIVETHGRIAALLELGSGFNPDFTGRENVYMNSAVRGFTKDEVDARFDDIAAFADIGEFIDQPTKTYSSGMLVRLAFAVNIISRPDIMIVDEALAVGDMNFQTKCMTALKRIQHDGTTVLFVSHDMGAVKSLCKKAIYLEHGLMKFRGEAPAVAEMYVRTMREEMSGEVWRYSRISAEVNGEKKAGVDELPSDADNDFVFKRSPEFDKRVAVHRYGSGGAKISYVELVNEDGGMIQSVAFNETVAIRIYVESEVDRLVSVNFSIYDDKKINLVECGFSQIPRDFLRTKAGRCYCIEYTLRLPLQEGVYSICAHVSSPIIRGESAEFADVVEDAVVFRMERWSKARIWSKVHLFPSIRITSNGNMA